MNWKPEVKNCLKFILKIKEKDERQIKIYFRIEWESNFQNIGGKDHMPSCIIQMWRQPHKVSKESYTKTQIEEMFRMRFFKREKNSRDATWDIWTKGI
jgi:hypothetical protein